MDTKLEEPKVEKKTYTYRTKSLDEFAVALALGAEVTGVKHEEGDRFLTFILRAEFDIENIALQLASRTLTVNAYDLCESLRRAKSLVHSH